jgi:AcrR family transcriptional regulator
VSLHDQLREIALTEFASAGYAATSLQRIADLAGTSKASVLYHYASKEQLLADAMAPALDELTAIVSGIGDVAADRAQRIAFLERFVDALLAHREVVHLIVNQSATQQDVPAFARAQALMRELSEAFELAAGSTLEKLRYGIALAGAAYTLAASDLLGLDSPPVDEIRPALNTVLRELLAPESED